MMTTAELGEILRRRREELGMSQYDLARASGVTHTTICRIENGYATSTFGSMLNILDALEMKIGFVKNERPKKQAKNIVGDYMMEYLTRIKEMKITRPNAKELTRLMYMMLAKVESENRGNKQ